MPILTAQRSVDMLLALLALLVCNCALNEAVMHTRTEPQFSTYAAKFCAVQYVNNTGGVCCLCKMDGMCFAQSPGEPQLTDPESFSRCTRSLSLILHPFSLRYKHNSKYTPSVSYIEAKQQVLHRSLYTDV